MSDYTVGGEDFPELEAPAHSQDERARLVERLHAFGLAYDGVETVEEEVRLVEELADLLLATPAEASEPEACDVCDSPTCEGTHRRAASKSEYARLTAQGIPVLPPLAEATERPAQGEPEPVLRRAFVCALGCTKPQGHSGACLPAEVSEPVSKDCIDGLPCLGASMGWQCVDGKACRHSPLVKATESKLASGCHRSHPHENMGAECEALTEATRNRAERARLRQQVLQIQEKYRGDAATPTGAWFALNDVLDLLATSKEEK